MHIRVLFFGVLKDVAGLAPTPRSPENSTLADLLAHYITRVPSFEQPFRGYRYVHQPGIRRSIGPAKSRR